MSIKKLLKIVYFLSFAIMFASCANSVDVSAPANEEKEITYGFSGILQLDTNIYSDSSNSSRTAMPTLPSSAVYYVDYKLDSASEHFVKTSNDTGVFTTSGGRVSGFYLPLSVGKWVIEVGVNDNGTTILKDTKTVTLTPENPLMTNQVFFLKMGQTGTGSMKLKITAGSGSGVSSIKVILEDGRLIEKNSNNEFIASDIPSGEQRIDINAYDGSSTPQLIFSTIQIINIYDNIETNQWIIDGTTKETFEITKSMTDDFKPRQYFVDGATGGSGDDTNNTGTSSNSPFKTVKHAIDTINARAETYTFTIHVKDGSYELDNGTLEIKKNITIECWKNAPNDRLGSAKIVVRGGTKCVLVGPTADDKPVNFYLQSLADDNTSGLEINGNGLNRCGVYIENGIFVMNGGVINETGEAETEYGGIVLPDVQSGQSVERQFIMLKGTIKNSKGTKACGVYVGKDTIFQMEGGVISGNRAQSDSSYAVVNNGEMSIKGQIYISGNNRYDGNEQVLISGSGETQVPESHNLYLPKITEEGKEVINKLQVLGPISSDSQIGISAPVGTESGQLEPTGQIPVAITKNYMDSIAPSIIFKQDKSSPYVFMKSTDGATFGEVAFGLGGGVIYTSTDYSFSFASDTTAVTRNTAKDVIITVTAKRKDVTSELHYNPNDEKLYLIYIEATEESDAIYSNSAAEDIEDNPNYNKVTWTAELTLAGNSLPSTYKPTISAGAGDNKIKVSIPALPYKDNYTLIITATYLGIQYGANFQITCN